MYSFESCGVGEGGGAANGFQMLAFDPVAAAPGSDKTLPNQPVFLPDRASVCGSQPFLANTPRPIKNNNANADAPYRSLFRFDGSRVGIRDMGILLRNQIVKNGNESYLV